MFSSHCGASYLKYGEKNVALFEGTLASAFVSHPTAFFVNDQGRKVRNPAKEHYVKPSSAYCFWLIRRAKTLIFEGSWGTAKRLLNSPTVHPSYRKWQHILDALEAAEKLYAEDLVPFKGGSSTDRAK